MTEPDPRILVDLEQGVPDLASSRLWFASELVTLLAFRRDGALKTVASVGSLTFTHRTPEFHWSVPLLAELDGVASRPSRSGRAKDSDAWEWALDPTGHPLAARSERQFTYWMHLRDGTTVVARNSTDGVSLVPSIFMLSDARDRMTQHCLMVGTLPQYQRLVRVDFESARPVKIRSFGLMNRHHAPPICGTARYDDKGKLTDLLECTHGSILWTSRKLTPAWWKAHEARLVAHCAALAARPGAREILIAIGASMSDTVVFPDFAVRLDDGRLVRANPPSYPDVFKETDGIIGNVTASAVKKKLAALWSFADPRVHVRVVDTEKDLALADEIALIEE